MTCFSYCYTTYLLKLLVVGAVLYFDAILLFSLSFGFIEIPGT
jgi:hypothetical protein